MNKITDYRRGGVHPRPFGCNHQDVAKTARDSGQPQGMQGQPQGIAPTGFALVICKLKQLGGLKYEK